MCWMMLLINNAISRHILSEPISALFWRIGVLDCKWQLNENLFPLGDNRELIKRIPVVITVMKISCHARYLRIGRGFKVFVWVQDADGLYNYIKGKV